MDDRRGNGTTRLRRRATRLGLALRVVSGWATVSALVRIHPLPKLADRLSRPRRRRRRRLAPGILSRAVDRRLRIGRYRPRCLIGALVLYRLLRAQGDPAVLVIGLSEAGDGPDAHAWVELGGADAGPPPGRAGHVAMARFP